MIKTVTKTYTQLLNNNRFFFETLSRPWLKDMMMKTVTKTTQRCPFGELLNTTTSSLSTVEREESRISDAQVSAFPQR